MPKECAVCKQPAVLAARITRGEQVANVFLCENCVQRVAKKTRLEIIGSSVARFPKGMILDPAQAAQTQQKPVSVQSVQPAVSNTMYCGSCGKPIVAGVKFCPECGARTDMAPQKAISVSAPVQPPVQNHVSVSGTIQLRCKACGGIMTVQDNNRVLSCPYCGSHELLLESDDVTMQRIKSTTQKEIALEKLRQQEKQQLREIELQEKAATEAKADKFKKGKLSKFSVIFFILCLIFSFIAFRNGRILSGIIGIAQSVLFALTWLMGMQIIKNPKNTHALFAVIGFLLIIPFIYLNGRINMPTMPTATKKVETYVWPTSGINTVLPQPKSDKGDIFDTAEHFSIDVNETTEQDYVDYIDACVEKGFTIEAVRTSMNYDAYNEDGYKLSAYYFKSSQSMSINLDAPEALGVLSWPETNALFALPKPESERGNILKNTEGSFSAHVGDTTKEAFQKYVQACSENGFVDVSKTSETSFEAYNADGVKINVEYEGFNIMSIRLDVPTEQEDTSEKTSTEKSYDSLDNTNIDDVKDAVSSAIEEASSAIQSAVDEVKDSVSSITDEKKDEISSKIADSILGMAKDAIIDKAMDVIPGADLLIIRPEFKEAVDAYETFFDYYVDFMKRYSESGYSLDMFNEYLEYLQKYAETMEKMDELSDGAINTAETAYYLEAINRIEKKLLETYTP